MTECRSVIVYSGASETGLYGIYALCTHYLRNENCLAGHILSRIYNCTKAGNQRAKRGESRESEAGAET